MEEVCFGLFSSAELKGVSAADKLLVNGVFIRDVRHAPAKTGRCLLMSGCF